MKFFFSIPLLIFFQYTQIIADSNNLNLIGRWPYGPCNSVTIDLNYAYVGNGALVEIFDISSAQSISKTGEIITHGLVEQVEVNDSLLFVFNYDDGFGIYNVKNKSNPHKLSHTYLESYANQFFFSENFVYFSSDTFGLIIIDVSKPVTPTIAGTYKISGYIRGIFVKDNIAYVGLRDTGILLLDVSDPNAISELGNFQFEEDSYASHFHFKNNYLYVNSIPLSTGFISYGRFHVLDISNPLSPIELSHLSLPGDWSSYLTNIFVENSLAFVTTTTDVGDCINVINVTDPLNLILEHSIFADNPKDVIVQNFHCYLSDGYSGFKIYDYHLIEDPTLLYHYLTNGPCQSIFINDNYAYIASGRAGLRSVDISNPRFPSTIGLFNEPQIHWLTTSDVAVKDNYAYLVNVSGGLNVLDISDPLSLQEISWFDGPLGRSICIEGDYAFIANRYNGLFIVNINNPKNPMKAYSLDASFTGHDVFVKDTLLFLAGGSEGTKIFNVIDPNNPGEISTIVPNSYSSGVYMLNDVLYIAEGDAGLRVFDVTNTKNPHEICQFSKEGYFVDVKVKNDFAFVADSRFGLRVFNVQKCDSIFEVASYRTDDSAQDIFLQNDLIYLADMNDGFYVFDISIEDKPQHPRQYILRQNYPNPFNSITTIEFNLPYTQYVSLKIFNILGEKVTTLVSGELSDDKYKYAWDAGSLASGIYFYRLETNSGFIETKKMVLLR